MCLQGPLMASLMHWYKKNHNQPLTCLWFTLTHWLLNYQEALDYFLIKEQYNTGVLKQSLLSALKLSVNFSVLFKNSTCMHVCICACPRMYECMNPECLYVCVLENLIAEVDVIGPYTGVCFSSCVSSGNWIQFISLGVAKRKQSQLVGIWSV